MKNEKEAKKKIIATRKTCNPDGTGLSHFILIDKDVKNNGSVKHPQT